MSHRDPLLSSDSGSAPRKGLLHPARRYVVAAEMEPQDAPRAHVVGDLGAVTVRLGMAMCGLPADVLVLVPSMQWAQVEEASRCTVCHDAWLDVR